MDLANLVPSKSYECDKCKDEGGFYVKKKAGETVLARNFEGILQEMILQYDTSDWQECTCARLKRINRLIKSSEITEEFQKMGFKNFRHMDVDIEINTMFHKALNYFENFQSIKNERENSITFIGQPGCGKTHLLTAISNGLIKEHLVPVLYFPFKDGMNNIAANKFERKNEIMQQMKDVDVLFVDDLFKPIGGELKLDRYGKPQIIDWQADIMYEVLNYRYLNKKPLLISTELGVDELLKIDEATYSRVFEMSGNHVAVVKKNVRNNYRLRNLYQSG
ncbi:DnaA/Hda family protein [Metasolibacillus sp.]|uniref:DnaA ATPase domain-containing protein n=1 Tax=Metasolibacillus sp. TaxID=2703680 RepID=UPI0025CBF7DA|nr:DnaA/Hda family protein [Metasolibacillus sp.]MCT6926336.1 DnaA/Hda family protein [Metasolibacillus sp.]